MSKLRIAGLVAMFVTLGTLSVNRANAQDMNASSRIGYWSNLSGVGSVVPDEALGVQDPATGEVTPGTVSMSGNVTFDPNSVEVTATYTGAYMGPAYASLNNTSTTDSYVGSPSLGLYAFGDIDQIPGAATSYASMDYASCGSGVIWNTGDPNMDYPYTVSSTFNTVNSSRGNGLIISIPSSTRFVWAGECDAHAYPPTMGGGTGGGGGS